MVTYDDVTLPPDRIGDQLRAEQYRHFRGESWLEESSACAPNDLQMKEQKELNESCAFFAAVWDYAFAMRKTFPSPWCTSATGRYFGM